MAINPKLPSNLLEYPAPIPAEGYPFHHEQESAGAKSRVIMLVPSPDIDIQQIRLQFPRLGITRSQEIVLLGKAERWTTNHHPNELFRLAIDLRSVGMNANHKMIRETDDWISAIKQIAAPTDLIICHAEYQGQKLSNEISAQLGLSALAVSGFYMTAVKRWRKLLGRGVFELLPLVLIIGTFWLQVQISTQTYGLLNSVLLVLTVLVEIGLLFGWSLLVK